jgi:hypothetical protein
MVEVDSLTITESGGLQQWCEENRARLTELGIL